MKPAKLQTLLPALLSLCFLLTACGSGAVEVAPSDRQPAPAFSLAAVDGSQLSLEDLTGKVTILDFWATWCAPCHLQAEILEEIKEEYEGEDLQIVSIDTGEKAEKVRAFVEKNPKPFPVLIDADSKVSDEFEVFALPTVILLDRQGRIAFTNAGITEASILRPLIRAELGNA